ncbi:hypothetical protein [Brevundimonas sp. DWR2-3-1b1]|uniref:hypothetical protein n=1 Tax=unclassified Brevundimonas TaxID=2622653 RepID=UPI003CF36CE0
MAAQEVGALNDPNLADVARQRLWRELGPVLQVSAEATAIKLGMAAKSRDVTKGGSKGGDPFADAINATYTAVS